jgi:uncharacterized membrane protein YphA (DoxX/SURF4 family)
MALAVAAAVIGFERLGFSSTTPQAAWLLIWSISGAVRMIGSAFVAIGFHTRRVVCVFVLVEIALMLARFFATSAAAPDGTEAMVRILDTMIAGALALTGPGAYSIDARMHGRHEIIIPPKHERAS